MSRLDDQLERHLTQIAGRATPSPTAWETIQSRIATEAPHPEMEITMLSDADPNPRTRWPLMAGAAAVLVLVVGGIVLLNRDDDGNAPADTRPTPVTTVDTVDTTIDTTQLTTPATTDVTDTSPATTEVPADAVAPPLSYDPTVALPGGDENPFDLVFDGTDLWTANIGSANLTRIDPVTGDATNVALPDGAEGPQVIAFDGDELWVSNPSISSVTRFDPATG